MELLKLLGIVIVIAGFALKLDSILVILVAAVVTALVGGLGPVTLLETLGSTFVANRSMAIFIIVMLVTGTLERNGLREAAAALIGKFKGATSGLVIGIYGVMRSVFAAFNVGFGGVAGFVRPIIMPMAEGAIVAQGYEPNEEHVEELKGMAAGYEEAHGRHQESGSCRHHHDGGPDRDDDPPEVIFLLDRVIQWNKQFSTEPISLFATGSGSVQANAS